MWSSKFNLDALALCSLQICVDTAKTGQKTSVEILKPGEGGTELMDGRWCHFGSELG